MEHFIADFEGFLKLGIKGKKAVISSSENPKYKNAMLSALLSSANTACDKFPNGCPAMITLNKSEIAKTEIISSVLKTYFKSGGFHLAINTVDSEILRKARQRPEEYIDILVKISWYSTLFSDLTKKYRMPLLKDRKM